MRRPSFNPSRSDGMLVAAGHGVLPRIIALAGDPFTHSENTLSTRATH